MIKIFNGKWRGLGNSDPGWGLVIDFRFREYLHHFSGARLHILLAIMLHTNEDGLAWPSYDLLQKETGYSRATIAQALDDLCEMEIEGERVMMKYRQRDEAGRYIGSNQYRIFPTQEEVENVQSLLFPTLEKSNGGETEPEVKPSIKDKPNKEKVNKDGANAPHPLAPPSPQSVYLFDRLNEDRATKNRTPVTRYGTAQQRDDTDAALMKLDRAGQMQKAVDWALRNERTSRASLCNAVIAWAKNLDKPKPTHNTRANGAPNIYDVLDKLEAERER